MSSALSQKGNFLDASKTIWLGTEGECDTFMEGKDEPLPPEERFEWPQGEAGSLL